MSKLTILGSGTAVSGSYPSGYLLTHEDHNYLIDSGEGLRHRLANIKVDYIEIDTVFLSHFHPDHFNIETIIQSIMVRNFTVKNTSLLTVFGPPETKTRLERIWDSKHNIGHFKKTLPEYVNLEIHEYSDRKQVEVGDLKFTPFALTHGNMPAFAMRFEIGSKIFTYSGDTGVNERVVKAALDADLFLCACNMQPGKSNPGHLNPKQAGEISVSAKAKKVVLTHLPGLDSEEIILNDLAGSGFKGAVHMARDFDVLQL